MATYTIERATYPPQKELAKFLDDQLPVLFERFGQPYEKEKFDLKLMCEKGLFLYCIRNRRVTGIHISFLYPSVMNANFRVLSQQVFYVKPGSGRTAYHLFKNFIDIGKLEANHIITMLTSFSNIKPESLEKFGFKELETLYRLEV